MNAEQLTKRFTLLLFHVLVLIVPLLFTSVNEELFEFNKMLGVYAVTILLAGCWAVQSIAKRKPIWGRTPFDVPILFFLGSQVISTVFSMNVHTSLFGYYTRFNGGLLSTISYIWIYYMAVFFLQKKDVMSLIKSTLVGAVLASLYAFPEHFGASPSCLLFSGKFDVACWVQDVQTRVFGTFGQPNWLAAYLALLLPISIVFLRSAPETKKALLEQETDWKRRFSQLGRIGMVLLFVAVLFFTRSRSGIAGAGVGLALLAFLEFKSVWSHRLWNRLWIYAFGAFACLIMLTVVGSPFNNHFLSLPNYWLTMLTTPPVHTTPAPSASAVPAPAPGGSQLELGGSESGEIRKVVWEGAIKVWQRYPIFGSGVETFAYSYYRDRLKEHNTLSEWDFLYNKAHNEFLNYLATTGLVGLLSYLFLYGSFIVLPILWALQRHSDKHTFTMDDPAALMIAGSSGLVALAISNFFGFSTVVVSLLTFLLPAFFVGMHQDQPHTQEEKTRHAEWTVVILVFAATLLPLSYLVRLWSADVSFAKGKQLDAARQIQPSFMALQDAVLKLPEEPEYHDELSWVSAEAAVALAQNHDSTNAAQLAQLALQESDTTIQLNSVHTSYYKTRIKVLLTLAELQPSLYADAKAALLKARELSPTDPRLLYYLGLLAQQQGDNTTFENDLLAAIALKPNDELSRSALGEYYLKQKNCTKAVPQYQYVVQFINPNNKVAQDHIASCAANLH